MTDRNDTTDAIPGHEAESREHSISGSVKMPWARALEEVLSDLQVDPTTGLNHAEMDRRRKRFGTNRLRETRRRSRWWILLDQFKSMVLLVLLVAAGLAFAVGEFPEGIAIVAVVLINGFIGFATEWRAIRSMEALRRMSEHRVRVRREGQERDVPVADLVPGDIVFLEGGAMVPADLRVLEANNLRADEAALTGESVPVVKQTDPAPPEAVLAERHSMFFRGTTITEGSAEGVVVATGMDTELGKIARLTQQAEKQATPLERRLEQLSSRLAWIVLGIAVIVALAGLFAGRPRIQMIETAIALGIAAIPEGLPIVATIALARGMWLMARRQALINRLTAVETLGATRIIFSDKTGTLTENRMTLHRVVTPAGEHVLNHAENNGPEPQNHSPNALQRRAIEIGVLCNNASLADMDQDGKPDVEQGDPTEVAMLQAGLRLGIDRETLLTEKPEIREVAFNADTKMMATLHDHNGQTEVVVKGAPEPVLQACTWLAGNDGNGQREMGEDARRDWIDQSEMLARDGLRVLAVADKQVTGIDTEPYDSLRFVGLIGLYDPPRKDVAQSIADCRKAGIRVIMVTGDQIATARAIGCQIGLADSGSLAIHGKQLPESKELSSTNREELLQATIFARVSPAQKLQLIKIFQDAGETVAMTGDGINDAPALKKADIGVAMGRRGTDAAREAADMVLKDDALSSIVAAVEQGRVIFGNIRKSIMFMLCTNVAEILAVTIAAVGGLPIPLKPLQILFLNIGTDVFPALALSVGKGDPHIMEAPPRDPKESLITPAHWLAIAGWSALVAGCVLGALMLATEVLGFDETTAVTVSFLTLAFSKLWFVHNLRDPASPLLNNDIMRNPWVWGATALCTGLLLAAVYMPGLSHVLKTQPPDLMGWFCALGMSLVPLVFGQLVLLGRKQAG